MVGLRLHEPQLHVNATTECQTRDLVYFFHVRQHRLPRGTHVTRA